jgi:diguanylate cyclase (GGDEF)-like protein
MSIEQAYFFSVALMNLVFSIAGTRVKEHEGNSIVYFMVSFLAYFLSWFVYALEINTMLEIVGAISASTFVWGMAVFAAKRCAVKFSWYIPITLFALQCYLQIYSLLQADLTTYLHVSAVFLPIAFFSIAYMFLKLKSERNPSDVVLGYAFIMMAIVIVGRSILLETSPELFSRSSLYTQIIWPAFCTIIGVFSLLSYTEEAQIRLQQESNIDHLTNLANRRMFEVALSRSIAQLKRAEQYGALIYLDLDKFKPINDQYGHSVGDQLLGEIGRRLLISSRNGEVAARLGGDEFALLLTQGCKSYVDIKQQAETLALRLQALINIPVICSGHQIRISSSIGIHIIEPSSQNVEMVLTAADNAMYQSKALKNGAIIFSIPTLTEPDQTTAELSV